MRRMIIAKLHNVTGIMNRFTAVLNRRQVNILSITAGVTESQDLTHTTFVIEVDHLDEVEQIIKQLNRLIEMCIRDRFTGETVKNLAGFILDNVQIDGHKALVQLKNQEEEIYVSQGEGARCV